MTLVVDRIGDKKHWEIPLANWFKWIPTANCAAIPREVRLGAFWASGRPAQARRCAGILRARDRQLRLQRRQTRAGFEWQAEINIISQETLSIQITDAIRAVAEKVRQNAEHAESHQAGDGESQEGHRDKPEIDNGDKTALNRLNDQQNTLATQTRQLGGQMQDIEKRMEENRSENAELKDIAKDVKTTLNETAENQMTDAARKLAQAAEKADQRATRNEKGQLDPKKAEKSAAERNDALQNSEKKQQEASENLQKALDKMGNLGTFEQLLQRVRDALAQQQGLSKQLQQAGRETIGKKPEELTPEQKKKLDQIAAEQKRRPRRRRS